MRVRCKVVSDTKKEEILVKTDIQNSIKIVSIVFIVISILSLLINTVIFILFQNDEIISLYERFGIDVSYYIKEQKLLFLLNYIFSFSLLVTSSFTYKLNNFGRIGFNLTLIIIIIFFLIAPLIFNAELPFPQNSSDGSISMNLTQNGNSQISVDLFTYIIAIIKSAVLIAAIYFFSKKDVVQLYKTT